MKNMDALKQAALSGNIGGMLPNNGFRRRRKNSVFAALVFGVILFFGSFFLLWWNEGRSIHRAEALDEGLKIVVSVASDSVASENEGKLIHTTGKADTSDIIRDTTFGINENALKIKRRVEVYQWHRKTDKHSNSSNYIYVKDWSDRIEESHAGYRNPEKKPYDDKTFSASNVSIGAFQLSSQHISEMDFYTEYQISDENLSSIPERDRHRFVISDNKLYRGSPESPNVGDVRISFKIIRPGDVSVIGKQSGSVITPYQTSNGPLNIIYSGIMDAKAVFKKAEEENMLLTWGLRALGFFLMWMGMTLPLSVMAEKIPFIGRYLSEGVAIITLFVALVLSLTTIAVAWFYYRPIVSGILGAVAVVLMITGRKVVKGVSKNSSNEPKLSPSEEPSLKNNEPENKWPENKGF